MPKRHPPGSPEADSSRLFFWAGLLALLGGAAYLRFGAIAWGAPFVYHPDEHFVLQPALDIVRNGDPNPHWFEYPSLLIYLEAGLVAVLRRFTGAPLESNSLVNGIGPWDALPEQWPFVLAGRLLVAAAAVLAVALLAQVGRRLYGPAAGLLAGAFLLAAALHHQSSHYLTTDVPATTLIVACMAASLAARPRWLLAGILAGLAAGTKYTAGLALAVPLLVSLDDEEGGGFASLSTLAERLLRIATGFLVGFFASTPYALLDLPAFLDGLEAQRRNYFAWRGQEGNLRWYLEYLWRQGLGPLLAALAGLGLAQVAGEVLLALRRRDRLGRGLAILLPPLLYIPWLASFPSRAERNLLVVLPFLCLAGADVARRLCGIVRAPRLAAALLAAVGVVVLAVSLPPLRELNQRLELPDNRTLALEWIRANLPKGTKIAREEYTPQLAKDEYDVTYVFSLSRRPYSEYVSERVGYLIASSNVYGRAVDPPYIAGEAGREFYRVLFGLPLLKEFPQGPATNGPTVRIYRVPLGP